MLLNTLERQDAPIPTPAEDDSVLNISSSEVEKVCSVETLSGHQTCEKLLLWVLNPPPSTHSPTHSPALPALGT